MAKAAAKKSDKSEKSISGEAVEATNGKNNGE